MKISESLYIQDNKVFMILWAFIFGYILGIYNQNVTFYILHPLFCGQTIRQDLKFHPESRDLWTKFGCSWFIFRHSWRLGGHDEEPEENLRRDLRRHVILTPRSTIYTYSKSIYKLLYKYVYLCVIVGGEGENHK